MAVMVKRMSLTSTAGRSLSELMADALLDACRRYIEMRSVPTPDPAGLKTRTALLGHAEALAQLRQQRGIVRGCARMVAIWRNAYRHGSDDVSEVEKEFMKKAKEQWPEL